MSYDNIATGSVILYPYLWCWQSEAGETEGRKKRPTAVSVRIKRKDGDVLLLLPITSKMPDASRRALEIPDMEKHRAGLDRSLRLWIILDEFNTDMVGQSWYLEPNAVIGQFSKAFFLPVLKMIIQDQHRIRAISRNE